MTLRTYFEMLDAELKEEEYTKAEDRRDLKEDLSDRSGSAIAGETHNCLLGQPHSCLLRRLTCMRDADITVHIRARENQEATEH